MGSGGVEIRKKRRRLLEHDGERVEGGGDVGGGKGSDPGEVTMWMEIGSGGLEIKKKKKRRKGS